MNNTMVREIRGANINPKSSFKIRMRKRRRGGNYESKYGMLYFHTDSSTTLLQNIYSYLSKGMVTYEKAVIFHCQENLSLSNENIIYKAEGICDVEDKFSTLNLTFLFS